MGNGEITRGANQNWGSLAMAKKDDGRFKARLVAKGHSQLPAIDYKETFGWVAKFSTLRTPLALRCENDCED